MSTIIVRKKTSPGETAAHERWRPRTQTSPRPTAARRHARRSHARSNSPPPQHSLSLDPLSTHSSPQPTRFIFYISPKLSQELNFLFLSICRQRLHFSHNYHLHVHRCSCKQNECSAAHANQPAAHTVRLYRTIPYINQPRNHHVHITVLMR